ncbi:MAG: hypothetical protein EBS65_16820, partial [Betaproteobacteria bacterium]|nr:hypothetical protein [Betaproteobacteria bacterium]
LGTFKFHFRLGFCVRLHRYCKGSCNSSFSGVGVRPTVKENAVPLLEAHLFDYAGDLYGRRIEVKFLHKLRDEEKYPDLDTLKDAIARDAAHARDFFAAKSHG